MLIEIATELNGVEDWKRNKQEVLVYAENVIKQAKERINASHGGQSSDEVEVSYLFILFWTSLLYSKKNQREFVDWNKN